MKLWGWLIGMLAAILLESALVNWPFLLWFIWWTEAEDERLTLALILISGIVLDALMVRLLGLSSLGLTIFYGGLQVIRKTFSGKIHLEILWLMVGSALWYGWLGGGWNIKGTVVMEVALVALVVLSQNRNKREIRLK